MAQRYLAQPVGFWLHKTHMPSAKHRAALVTILIAALAIVQSGGAAGGSAAALPQSSAGPPFDLSDRAFILCWHTFLGKKSLNTDFSLEELAAQKADA